MSESNLTQQEPTVNQEYDQPNLDSLKFAEGVARDIVKKQLESTDTLVTGASILIGLGGILIGLLLTGGIPSDYSGSIFFLALALISILFSLIFALLAAKSTKYNFLYNPRKLWNWTSASELSIITRVYERLVVDIESNQEILDKKWSFMLYSFGLLLLGIFSMIIYIFMNLLGW